MTELPGRLIQEFKEFERDIDKVRLFLLTRVSQMEKLLQDTTVRCPGVADIWRDIRALVQTEVVQRKVVWKSIDEGLAELHEAKAPYSDDLSKLTRRWAKFEEQHRTLCEEHSRAKQYCEDSFSQSKAADMPAGVPPSPPTPISPDTPNRRTLSIIGLIKKGTTPSKSSHTRCPTNSDLIQADLRYRRAVTGLNGIRREAGDILDQSYHRLAEEEQEYLEKLKRVARLYGETTIAISAACSESGSSLSFTVARLSTAVMVSHILDKIALEIEDSYFQPFQYHNFNYHSTHDYILFGIDLAHYKQYLEYKGTKVPSILGLLLEDIEVRGEDGVEVYTAQHYGLMQLAHNLEQLWHDADSENQRLIEATDVTVSGELIKYFFSTLPRRLVHVDRIYLYNDGPPRTEVTTVEPKPNMWEKAVWQTMISHLQRLSFRGAPNGRRLHIAAGLAGKLGPLLVGCEDPAISVQFLRDTILGIGDPLC